MASRPGCSSLAVTVQVAPAWWRRGCPSEISVDATGVWHFRTQQAGVQSVLPDRIDMGPCNLWMTLSGPAIRTSRDDPAGSRRRVHATLWASSVPQHAWRRLRIAAHWHMQRATAPVQGTA